MQTRREQSCRPVEKRSERRRGECEKKETRSEGKVKKSVRKRKEE
jgi:hypothetical protein